MSEEQRFQAKGSEATLNRFMSDEQKQETPPVFFLILGIFLIFLFGSGLFSMEKHFSEQKSSLDYIKQRALALPSVSSLDTAFEGKLIHAQGSASTNESITDPQFGINVKALGLVYHVEYYQDVDTGEGFDEGWTDRPTSFLNPQDYALNARIMPELENKTIYVQQAKLGVYDIAPDLLQGLHNAVPLDLKINPEQIETLHTYMLENGKKALHTPSSVAQYLKALQQGEQPRDLAKIVDNSLYFGYDPSEPSLGDTRLTFFIVPEQEVSLIGTIEGNTLHAFKEANGELLPLIYAGKLNSDSVIDMRSSEDSGNIWGLRMLFSALIIFGARMVISYYRRSAEEKQEHSALAAMNPWGPSLALGIALTVIIAITGQVWA